MGSSLLLLGQLIMRTLEWGCHIEEVAKSGWAYLSPALGKRMAQTSRWEGIGEANWGKPTDACLRGARIGVRWNPSSGRKGVMKELSTPLPHRWGLAWGPRI